MFYQSCVLKNDDEVKVEYSYSALVGEWEKQDGFDNDKSAQRDEDDAKRRRYI